MDHVFRVDATISGKSVRLCIDTGFSSTMLSPVAAQRLGLALRSRADVTLTDATGLTRSAESMVTLVDLKLGATTFGDFDAVCHSIDDRMGCEGFVGMDVLGTGVWWFDAVAQVVHMLPPADVDAAMAARRHRVVARLPLGAEKSKPFVTVRVEDRVDVALLLDTGAASTSLPQEVVVQLALPSGDELARQRAEATAAGWAAAMAKSGLRGTVKVTPEDGQSIGVHGISEQRSLHHLRQLTLGARPFADLLVTSTPRHGCLGRDVLGKCTWLLHGPRHELWLLAPE
jgi:predicted aspartyl protease